MCVETIIIFHLLDHIIYNIFFPPLLFLSRERKTCVFVVFDWIESINIIFILIIIMNIIISRLYTHLGNQWTEGTLLCISQANFCHFFIPCIEFFKSDQSKRHYYENLNSIMMTACFSCWLRHIKVLIKTCCCYSKKNIFRPLFKKPHTHRATFSLLTLSFVVIIINNMYTAYSIKKRWDCLFAASSKLSYELMQINIR